MGPLRVLRRQKWAAGGRSRASVSCSPQCRLAHTPHLSLPPPRRRRPRRLRGCARSGRRSARSMRSSRWGPLGEGAGRAGKAGRLPLPLLWRAHGGGDEARGAPLQGLLLGAVFDLRACLANGQPRPQARLDAEIAARAEQERLVIEQQRAAVRAAEEQRRRCVHQGGRGQGEGQLIPGRADACTGWRASRPSPFLCLQGGGGAAAQGGGGAAAAGGAGAAGAVSAAGLGLGWACAASLLSVALGAGLLPLLVPSQPHPFPPPLPGAARRPFAPSLRSGGGWRRRRRSLGCAWRAASRWNARPGCALGAAAGPWPCLLVGSAEACPAACATPSRAEPTNPHSLVQGTVLPGPLQKEAAVRLAASVATMLGGTAAPDPVDFASLADARDALPGVVGQACRQAAEAYASAMRLQVGAGRGWAGREQRRSWRRCTCTVIRASAGGKGCWHFAASACSFAHPFFTLASISKPSLFPSPPSPPRPPSR